jgi:hypothetical protein
MKPIEEKEALLEGLKGDRADLLEQIKILTENRQALPRSAVKTAKDMQLQINALMTDLRGLKMPIFNATANVDKADRHGLWEMAVKTLWGNDGLIAARAKMRQLKISREHQL